MTTVAPEASSYDEELRALLGAFEDKGLSQEYVKAVWKLAEKKSDERFLNDSAIHAELVARLMIGRAKTETLIYTETLLRGVYEDAIKSAQGKVLVLAEKPEIASWAKSIREDIEIQPLKHSLGDHFFVVDGESFREEIDHQKTTARSCFHDREKATALRDRFMSAW